MADLGDTYRNFVLDAVFGGAGSRPATVYCALFTAAPSHAGGGTEVSGTGYARAAITNNTTNFPPASSGSQSNGTPITFPAAGSDWGNVVAFAYFDASSGGNLIGWGVVSGSPDVPSGSIAQFDIGALVVTAA